MKQAVMNNLLKFGIPKGSLEEATVELFRKAGWRITTASRSYFPSVDDDEMKCSLIRPQEMGRYVERGTIDVGIAGRDWVRESDSDVVEICEMAYSKVSRGTVRWVLVVNEGSDVRSPEDLRGGTISTELVGFTQRYFAERNIAHVPMMQQYLRIKAEHPDEHPAVLPDGRLLRVVLRRCGKGARQRCCSTSR
jgi:ATP phosphoribosyltransferase